MASVNTGGKQPHDILLVPLHDPWSQEGLPVSEVNVEAQSELVGAGKHHLCHGDEAFVRAGVVAEVNALPEFRKTNGALSPLRADMGEVEGGADDGIVSWEPEIVL